MLTELTVDTDAATSCRQIIIDLQNAYMKLTTGNTRLKVRFQERWVEYNPASARALMELIQTVWAQCPDTDGLLNLNPAMRGRGGPGYLRVT